MMLESQGPDPEYRLLGPLSDRARATIWFSITRQGSMDTGEPEDPGCRVPGGSVRLSGWRTVFIGAGDRSC